MDCHFSAVRAPASPVEFRMDGCAQVFLDPLAACSRRSVCSFPRDKLCGNRNRDRSAMQAAEPQIVNGFDLHHWAILTRRMAPLSGPTAPVSNHPPFRFARGPGASSASLPWSPMADHFCTIELEWRPPALATAHELPSKEAVRAAIFRARRRAGRRFNSRRARSSSGTQLSGSGVTHVESSR